MAWMAAALPYIKAAGAVMAVAGTVKTSQAQKQYGKQQYEKKEFEAEQLEDIGKADIAASHVAAQEKRRRARFASSRALALAAASGGGALDPNVVNIIAGIEEEGEFAAQTELYAGEEAARRKKMGAGAARYEGYSELMASRLRAKSTLLSGFGSLLSKYGG